MKGVSAKPPAGARRLSDPAASAEADRAGQPFLLFSDRDGRQQRFELTPQMASATVGRGSASDLVLDGDAQVSRIHARFERVGDDWEVIDDGMSSNGTFVNDKRLSGRRRLNDGDVLRLGRTTLTFRSPQRGRLEALTPPKHPPRTAITLSSTQRRVLLALCRPSKARGEASPATDDQIAEEVVLSVSEVRAHLRVLFVKLEVDEAPQAQRRARLVEHAFSLGVIAAGDL
jgi:predicted component of type VI protein secretion system